MNTFFTTLRRATLGTRSNTYRPRHNKWNHAYEMAMEVLGGLLIITSIIAFVIAGMAL